LSPRRQEVVSQLVEKYATKYAQMPRDLMRKLIRLENPDLFHKEKCSNFSSNLKTLDRELRKKYVKNPIPRKQNAKRLQKLWNQAINEVQWEVYSQDPEMYRRK
jgi:DNA repair ATPase RecN